MKKHELKTLVKEEIKKIISELELVQDDDAIVTDSSDVSNKPEVVDDVEDSFKSDLSYIADKAKAASEAETEEEPEAWVKSHVNAAKELIGHVSDYMALGKEEPTEEPIEEPVEEPVEQPSKGKPIQEAIGINEKKAIVAEIARLKAIAKRTPEEDGKLKDLEEKLKLSESKDNEKKVIDAEISNLESKPNKSAADITRLKNLKLKLVSCGAACMAIPGGFIKKEEKEIKGAPIAKVKKSDASKVKDMAKEFAAKGEHANILKMVKKLENYLKTHIKKEVE